MNPRSKGLLESSLYVNDVVVSARFYEKIFGSRTISDFGERGCAMQAGDRQILLLFKKGGSRLIQSPHDGDGEFHVAFAIPTSELSSWEAWLAENGIAVEEKRTWELGGRERVLSRSGPAPDRNRNARCLVDLLTWLHPSFAFRRSWR